MQRIPRHFHFVFGLRPQREPFHVAFYLCLESCLRVNRPDRITLYYHHEPHGRWWDRIRSRIELVRVPLSSSLDTGSYTDALVRRYSYAHVADFVRLEKLLEHGGVYADMDTLFIRPYPDALFEHSCVLGRESPVPAANGEGMQDSLCNAVILAEPGAPFIRRWLEEMPAAFDGSWSAHSCQLAARLAASHPEELHVEPPAVFYPYLWTREDLSALFEKSGEPGPEALSMHLWNHLWWDADRLDFLRFNGEALTERHIRAGRTTYARLARPFLPPRKDMNGWRDHLARLTDPFREIWSRRHFRRDQARALAKAR